MLNSAQMTVLERQQARQIQHQQQQQQQSFFNEPQFNMIPVLASNHDQFQNLINSDTVIRDFVNRTMKLDPGVDNGWPDFAGTGIGTSTAGFGANGYGMVDYPLSRTSSCPTEVQGGEVCLPEKVAAAATTTTSKKRKAPNSKIAAEEVKDKKSKADSEAECKITEQNNSNSSNSNTTTNNNTSKETSANSKDNSKPSPPEKQDFIHVRARRGQATDSHSLAERVRREKISERMKYLQDLVPGCNKITGKAGMLDEIINYVQSLQRQVEFLSMKLAAVNPRLDFNIENFFAKEILSATTGGFPTSDVTNCSGYLPFNSLQQMVSTCGLDMVMNSSDAALQRTRSAPVSDAFMDASCFSQAQPTSTWETDVHNLYNVELNQARVASTYAPQSFTGILEANNLKMEL